MRGLAALAALAASCGGGRKGGAVVPTPADVPAATWATEVPPYRLPTWGMVMWLEDDRAYVPMSTTAIAAVSLATGEVEFRRTEGVTGDITGIARLANGRLVVSVVKQERLRLYEVGADLGLTLMHEDPDSGWSSASIAVARDGRVALSGEERPLNLYGTDAAQVDRTLSPGSGDARGWTQLGFADAGQRLLARHDGDLYAFELATGAGTELGMGDWQGGAANVPRGLARMDGKLAVIDLRTGKTTVEVRGEAKVAALSPDASRVARLADAAVIIHDGTSGAELFKFDLGVALVTGAPPRLGFTPSGKKLVVTTGAVMRVIDLAARTITPAGPGPYHAPAFVAVTPTHVIVGADRVRRWPIGGGPAEQIGPDGPILTDGTVSPSGALVAATRLLSGTDDDGEKEITIWSADPPAEMALWPRSDTLTAMAVDDDGVLMVGAFEQDASPSYIAIDLGRTRGGWRRLFEGNYDGYVDVIDPVSRLAVLSRAGAVRLIRLPGTAPVSTARVPSCASNGDIYLDPESRHLTTDDDKELWLWDVRRSEGRRLAVVTFGGKIGEVVWVPGKPEIVVDLDDRIVVWNYERRRAVTTPISGIIGNNGLGIDAAGTHVAASLTNGRLLVFTLDVLRKGTPIVLGRGDPDADRPCEADPLEPAQQQDE